MMTSAERIQDKIYVVSEIGATCYSAKYQCVLTGFCRPHLTLRKLHFEVRAPELQYFPLWSKCTDKRKTSSQVNEV